MNKIKDFNKLVEETHDKLEDKNISTCPEYASDISLHLRERERLGVVKQIEVKGKQRESIVEWIISAQLHFKLKDETLYMALGLFDRFLGKQEVTKEKVALVGVTVILIAAKYEEIYPPHLKDFSSYCGEDFRRSEILAMELSILKALSFDLSIPSVVAFLQRLKKLTQANETKFNLAMFICEVQLLSSKMSTYPRSLLAISGWYLAERAMDNGFKLENLFLKEAKHTKEEIHNCAKEMLANVLIKEKIALSNISRKYRRCRDVFKIPLNSNLLN